MEIATESAISPNFLCMAIVSNFPLASRIVCAKAEISNANGDVAFPIFCLRCCRKYAIFLEPVDSFV